MNILIFLFCFLTLFEFINSNNVKKFIKKIKYMGLPLFFTFSINNNILFFVVYWLSFELLLILLDVCYVVNSNIQFDIDNFNNDKYNEIISNISNFEKITYYVILILYNLFLSYSFLNF